MAQTRPDKQEVEERRTLLDVLGVPDTFDEVTQEELPGNVEADFVPLSEEEETPDRRDIDPFQFDSLQAQEAFDAAVAASARGDEEDAIQQYIRAAKIAETAREWYVAAVACQRVGEFLADPHPPQDLDKAFRMFRRAVAAYEQCGLFAEARELSYRQMCCKLRNANRLKLPWSHRVELFLFWISAGFGFRPLRVIGMAIGIVMLYALIYWTSGGVIRAGHANADIDLIHAIYFSGVTFATVGYGDFIPAAHVRMLALTEGAVGALTMGFFVAVLANRLSRA
jgi:hypothetical protein